MPNYEFMQHPLHQLRTIINEQGVVVIDDVKDMPAYDDVYVSPHLVTSICHNGYVKARYDGQDVEFFPHDVALVMPNHSLETIEVSDDYQATLVVISANMFSQMRQHMSYRNFLTYHKSPSFLLNDEQYEAMLHLVSLLRSSSTLQGQKRNTVVLHLLEIMNMLIDEYRRQNAPNDEIATPVFMRFYDTLTEHYRESREVKFYADKLCLSPKYFGTVIRQETGTSASKWISNYIMLQAKSLLAHNIATSIKQVSRTLGFPDQATFARFFKANAGISPKEFREQH